MTGHMSTKALEIHIFAAISGSGWLRTSVIRDMNIVNNSSFLILFNAPVPVGEVWFRLFLHIFTIA